MGVSKDWRTYPAWGSLICGLLAVIATVVFFAYPKPVNDPSPVSLPESVWLITTFPISVAGGRPRHIGKKISRHHWTSHFWLRSLINSSRVNRCLGAGAPSWQS